MFFKKKQILILNADEFFVEPDKIYQQVLNFLGVRNYDLLKYEKFNFGDKNKINPDIRRHLIEFFKPHNEKLFNILGTRFDWN